MTTTYRLAAFALVAALGLAACGGDDDTGAPPTEVPTDDAATAPAGGGTVTLMGTDTLKWDPEALAAAAGTVTFEVTAGAAINHTLLIEELGDLEVAVVDPGETVTADVDLDAGTYTYYCSVPGHREAGMQGTLTVT